MEVKMEDNPVISRIWKEWLKKDKELQEMTEEERISLCKEYQWIYPKETKRMVDLEAIYSSVHQRRNRKEFHKWFYVVCGYILSRVHLGESSYYQYKKRFKKQFRREKVTSDEFPQMVLLVLGLLGYITGLRGGYRFSQGSDRNHGYPYVIDRERLLSWDCKSYYGETQTLSGTAVPEWVVTKTSAISFDEYGRDTESLSWTQHPEWLSERQYQSISSIEVVKEGIQESSRWIFDFNEYKNFCSLSEEQQESLMDDWQSYQKMRDLSCSIISGCKEDSYAGRFYHPLTNMRSDHRHRYLRLAGEQIAEIDVSSAQPTFLGLILYKETGVMSEWLEHALNGTFYEWIQNMTSTNEDRKTIKKWMMQYLYACYQPSKGKDYDNSRRRLAYGRKDKKYREFHKRLNRFLKENEPDIYRKIDCFKKNPQYRDSKGKWCSLLSHDLVEMEVEYIKACIHSLPEDIQFYTIHDCICVPQSRANEVRKIMEETSRKMYGLTIGLKIE